MRMRCHGCLLSTTDMCRAEKVIEITGPPSTVTQRSLYGHNAVSLSSVDVLHRAGGMTFDGAPIRHVPVSARTDTGPLGGGHRDPLDVALLVRSGLAHLRRVRAELSDCVRRANVRFPGQACHGSRKVDAWDRPRSASGHRPARPPNAPAAPKSRQPLGQALQARASPAQVAAGTTALHILR